MPYTYQHDTDGTEAEIRILAPDGRPIACIYFWDDIAQAEATRIVDALNKAMNVNNKMLATLEEA